MARRAAGPPASRPGVSVVFRALRPQSAPKGVPRFKSARRWRSFGFKEHGSGWRIDSEHATLRIANVGLVCVRAHRPPPAPRRRSASWGYDQDGASPPAPWPHPGSSTSPGTRARSGCRDRRTVRSARARTARARPAAGCTAPCASARDPRARGSAPATPWSGGCLAPAPGSDDDRCAPARRARTRQRRPVSTLGSFGCQEVPGGAWM